jgi:Glycosyl transferase family 2
MFLVAAHITRGDEARSLLAGANIDRPLPNSATVPHAFVVEGWAAGRDGQVTSVEFLHKGEAVARTRPDIERPDVAEHLATAQALRSGFRTVIDVSDFRIQELEAVAVFRSGESALIGTIQLHRYWRTTDHPAERHVVSVIITCFNQAHFLTDAIESCLAQTYPHVEIVVVDDGSIDNTGELVARYPRVRYVHQANQGVAGARNTGIRRSNGEFVVFLDGDDRLMPDALRVNVEHLIDRPACAFVSGEHRYIDADGQVLAEWARPTVTSDHYVELLKGNYIGCPSAVMFRRAVFAAVGQFDERFVPCEDYELFLRVARRFPVCAHGELTAEYRKHGESASDNPGRMLRAALTTLHAHRPFVKGDPSRASALASGIQYWRQYYGQPLARLARHQLIRRGHRLRGVRALWQLLRWHPAALPTALWSRSRAH